MRTIQNLFLSALVLMAGSLTSCTDYQDEIDALDKRVTILEDLVNKTNQNIDALQTIAEAAAQGWIIKGMAELPASDTDAGGYIINFTKIDTTTGEFSTAPEDNKTVTIYNGINGDDGTDGEDAAAPVINIKLDPTDGNYYWTVDGVWLTTPDGEKVRANGKDGEDGEDGKSTAPILDINDNGEWIISYDSGKSWNIMTDEDGNPQKATGKDGSNGKNGQDAKIIIRSVNIKVDVDGNRYIVLEIVGAGGNGEDVSVSIPLKETSSESN